MDIVLIAAIVCAILSGIVLVQQVTAKSSSLLTIGVFVLSLAIALDGLGVL